jgi:hypothetical protein
MMILVEATGSNEELDREKVHSFVNTTYEKELFRDAIISQDKSQEKVPVVHRYLCGIDELSFNT